MATITYGTSVKPVAKSNAAIRRRQRRKEDAIKRDLIGSRVLRAFGLKPEKRPVLKRVRPASPPNLKPLMEYRSQIIEAAEKYERRNHRIWYRDPNPLGNKIHAVQKSHQTSLI